MKKILINFVKKNTLRIATIKKNNIYDFKIENNEFITQTLNIYQGIIIKIEYSLEAIFVNYEKKKIGLLPFKEISKYYFFKKKINFNKNNIKYIFNNKQKIVVQIIKSEYKNKKAVLTTFIQLIGCYIILLPNSGNAIKISKKIQGIDRINLKKNITKLYIPKNMSLIIRTSGKKKSIQQLNQDIIFNVNKWEKIKKKIQYSLYPILIYQENNIMIRIFRDYLNYHVNEIIIDNINIFNLSYIYIILLNKLYLLNKIILYTWKIPLFQYYNVEKQIYILLKRKILLPSGGLIIIDFTESVTAIDVNSYKCLKTSSIEETALYTNLESVNEIVRQIRLRNIGGLIIIDFINMKIINNIKIVQKRIKQLILRDAARVKIGNISQFGILELSRQKLNLSSFKNQQYVCSQCQKYTMKKL
ncbi:Rne/Rng family ribonuclease [Buchnera aphidicola]|uniref:Rne/Rng family ribonuclease n=1 Tax=Buchnera aphidicola (Stegophylla sp.) TaxID=2315800 RepID=A0A4D6Y8U2_9GAMM|nr:Rne/Rng family ribonuclease [Buchnera aphidicola (Stegophylla sp.)]QCI26386.1 Rne/Rng family ribonuclease [Buchnera aphidicola (Stegophylla sp.)]